MVTLRTTALTLFIFASCFMNAQTIISGGYVSGNWNTDGSPYVIEDNITVDTDDKLTIKPGVSVLFTGNYRLEIKGRLDANGTENEKITFTLEDTTGFAEGTAGWKGISFKGYNPNNTEDSKMDHCLVEYSAGNGITCLKFPYLMITNTEIRFNKKLGILMNEYSDIVVQGVNIHHNGTGGIRINFSGPNVSDFIIEHNGGTGITLFGNSLSSLSPLFEQGEIRHNNSNSGGGGMTLNMDAFAELNHVNIYLNSALKGGGIYTAFGYLEMQNVIIRSNTAECGGGIFNDYGSTLHMDHTLIAENSAVTNGGGIYVFESYLEIKRSTFSNNIAGSAGGAIYYKQDFGQTGTISSSILWDNIPEEIYSTYTDPVIHHSNISGGFTGSGNINENPLFENVEGINYYLSWADFPVVNGSMSPCIDAGDPDEAMDADGTIADMGAYSFMQDDVTRISTRIQEVFTIYPNPASRSVTIRGTERIVKTSVLSLSGKVIVILEGGLKNSVVDVSQLESGIYFIQVQWENGKVSTEKLIKE